ncbi:hypothetical protein FACS1894116_10870 [Betaproteobacteria bacterium]|nr:hypothetical protein FACS1894116_10870 [Betaproteobacteria bacterium]GHT99780.1 hypothetical protein FACS1894154_07560 [Betaproteobacteria bacterium]GHU25547.1 hypothetical protein FACS189488_12850 [Betaproteobacteria bacterium]GHU30566.1 hypothetical protein FACS189497_10460 [Betaproteobacteria bacterium]
MTTDNFSVFQFISLNETRLSDILACLLEDVRLRNAFLECCGIPDFFIADERITIKTEVRTDKITHSERRMDIFINSKSKVLAIENKNQAQDQKNQLGDYLDQLGALMKDDYCLIYLTPKGKNISEFTLSSGAINSHKGKWRHVFWEDVLAELKKYIPELLLESPKKASFLAEFIDATETMMYPMEKIGKLIKCRIEWLKCQHPLPYGIKWDADIYKKDGHYDRPILCKFGSLNIAIEPQCVPYSNVLLGIKLNNSNKDGELIVDNCKERLSDLAKRYGYSPSSNNGWLWLICLDKPWDDWKRYEARRALDDKNEMTLPEKLCVEICHILTGTQKS